MKRLLILIAVLIGAGMSQVATAACTVVDADSMQCLVTYTEATENTDGTALTDLDHVLITFSAPNQFGQGPSFSGSQVVPATKATGGGTVTAFPVLVPVAAGQVGVDVTFKVYSVATDGRESGDSADSVVVARLDHPSPKPNAPVVSPIK